VHNSRDPTLQRQMAMRRFLVFVIAGAVLAGQGREASAILGDMRRALGGDAVLDAIRTFSAGGSVTKRSGPASRGLSAELLALLPDHFMTIERDVQSGGPIQIDIAYFNGFAGDTLIRRTDSTIPFPPDPGPQTPEAIAARDRTSLLNQKREFARLTLALFGKSVSGYPLDLAAAAGETVSGRAMEVVEARSPDGFLTRLYVDAATHQPAIVAWQAPPPVFITTSSSSVVRGGAVISQTPPSPTPPMPPAGADVTWRLELSDFKTRDGVTWPHRLRVVVGDLATEDLRIGRFRINPKIDTRRFDVRRER
jgi:hypothetical protein